MLLPRVIRLKDAADYLGMDKNRFNAEVRPHLTEIPIGKQGIAFDRLDLDAWFDDYKAGNGRPSRKEDNEKWDAKRYQGSSSGMGYGTLTKSSKVKDFAKALEQAKSKKRKDI